MVAFQIGFDDSAELVIIVRVEPRDSAFIARVVSKSTSKLSTGQSWRST